MQIKLLTKIFLIILLLCFAYTCTTTEPRRKGFVAKPCLDCHTKTLTEYQKKYIHEPMAKKDCEACHNRHGKIAVLSLKEREQRKLCVLCHKDFEARILKNKSVHSALKQGKCTPCHHPHASDNKYLLRKTGSEQCFQCHKKDTFVLPNQHKTLSDGCLICHNPHGSEFGQNLLKSEVELCGSCHSFSKETFKNAHKGYPVEKGKCTSCHTPHSSSDKKLLKKSVHIPVKNGECSSCHNKSSAPSPLDLKIKGVKLCYSCHTKEEMSFKETYRHKPVDEGKCLDCHNPHASDYNKITIDKLIEKKGVALIIRPSDTDYIERIEKEYPDSKKEEYKNYFNGEILYIVYYINSDKIKKSKNAEFIIYLP